MGTMLAINGQVINSQEPLPIPVDYDYLGETTGTTEIEIPKGYNEVYCDIIDSSSNTYYNTSFIADFDSRTRRGGYYFNASNYGGWIITWNSSTRKAKLTSAQSVGHDYTSTAKVKWYAMKHIMQSGRDGFTKVTITNGTISAGGTLDITNDIPSGLLPVSFAITGGDSTIQSNACIPYIWTNLANGKIYVTFKGWSDNTIIKNASVSGVLFCS